MIRVTVAVFPLQFGAAVSMRGLSRRVGVKAMQVGERSVQGMGREQGQPLT